MPKYIIKASLKKSVIEIEAETEEMAVMEAMFELVENIDYTVEKEELKCL